jgi:hypothetical protein
VRVGCSTRALKPVTGMTPCCRTRCCYGFVGLSRSIVRSSLALVSPTRHGSREKGGSYPPANYSGGSAGRPRKSSANRSRCTCSATAWPRPYRRLLQSGSRMPPASSVIARLATADENPEISFLPSSSTDKYPQLRSPAENWRHCKSRIAYIVVKERDASMGPS